MTNTPNTPAGWYPDPLDASQTRYWDGAQWTGSVAPSAVSTPAPSSGTTPPPAAPVTAATTAYAPPPAAPQVGGGACAPAYGQPPVATAQAKQPMPAKKKWLIGGAIAAGVIVVGSIGGALGGGKDNDANAEVAPSVAASAPEVVPSVTPSAVPEPSVEAAPVADPVAFRAQSNSHLDDMLKDLDDTVVTVGEKGFWRLLSNFAELSFNLGQLQALDVPVNVAETWPASLVALDASLTTLSDAITTEDPASILAAVEGVRVQVESTRGVANSAQ